MRLKARIWAVLFIGISLLNISAAQIKETRQLEQSVFGLEEDVKRPAEIPKGVLEELRKDEDTQLCFKDDGPQQLFTPYWYQASEIHLDIHGASALVVVPKNACMWGANIGPLWIFKRNGNKYVLVLKANAAGLEILKSRTNGVRDVKVFSQSAVEVYTNYVSSMGGSTKYFPKRYRR